MEVEGRALGPARTNFNDYVGTVAADDAEALLDQPSLSELAQIDRDRYTVLGIDQGRRSNDYVYLCNRRC